MTSEERQRYTAPGGSKGLLQDLQVAIYEGARTSGPMLVPAVVYSVQNTLNVVAGGFLSAAVLQAVQQLKILTAGIFPVILLGHVLPTGQWAALLTLLFGVLLVSAPTSAGDASAAASGGGALLTGTFAGLACALAAAICSGFAGVYTEKFLKRAEVGIWMRNVQLAAAGSAAAWIGVIASDGRAVLARGIFAGFNAWAWALMFLHVAAGFLVAFILKYARSGAILKNFATSASLAITLLLSGPIFGEWPIRRQLLGVALVAGGMFLYSHAGQPAAGKPTLPTSGNGEGAAGCSRVKRDAAPGWGSQACERWSPCVAAGALSKLPSDVSKGGSLAAEAAPLMRGPWAGGPSERAHGRG